MPERSNRTTSMVPEAMAVRSRNETFTVKLRPCAIKTLAANTIVRLINCPYEPDAELLLKRLAKADADLDAYIGAVLGDPGEAVALIQS